jgi:hypothetical protein
MEILEVLVPLIEGCGCFLEFMALGTNVGAGAAAVKAKKTSKQQQAARAQGDTAKKPNDWRWIFWILLSLGLFFTGWSLMRWARHFGWL